MSDDFYDWFWNDLRYGIIASLPDGLRHHIEVRNKKGKLKDITAEGKKYVDAVIRKMEIDRARPESMYDLVEWLAFSSARLSPGGTPYPSFLRTLIDDATERGDNAFFVRLGKAFELQTPGQVPQCEMVMTLGWSKSFLGLPPLRELSYGTIADLFGALGLVMGEPNGATIKTYASRLRLRKKGHGKDFAVVRDGYSIRVVEK